MWLFQDFLETTIYELVNLYTELFISIGSDIYYFENLVTGTLSSTNVDALFQSIAGMALGLLILKILKRGFFQYILWTEGDPDLDMSIFIVNMVMAICFIVNFQTLYGWYVDISMWLMEFVINALNMSMDLSSKSFWDFFNAFSGIKGLFHLAWLIMFLTLYLAFIKRSAEMFVLRLGCIIGAVGLMDSDRGVFASVCKVFLQISLTTTTQIFFLMLSVNTIVTGDDSFKNILIALSLMGAANAIPYTLQFILLQVGGGTGAGQKVSSILYAVNSVKGLITPK